MKTKLFFIAMLAVIGLSANAQWQFVGLDSNINVLAVKGDTIFAGTNGYGIYYSSNKGNSWTSVNTGLPWDSATNVYYSVSTFAIKGNNIFAGINDAGIFLSSNNGASWTSVNNGLLITNNETYIYALAVIDSNIFAGISLNGEGVYLSTNNGGSWTAADSGLPPNGPLSFAIKGDSIFAGIEEQDIYLSSNNGGSWTAVNTGLPAQADVYSLAISGSNIFAGTNQGVYVSPNNGANWHLRNTSLTCFVDAFAVYGTNVFAGTEGGCGVYLTNDNGSTWTFVGLPSSYVTSLVISGNNLFAATDDQGVFKITLSELVGIKEITNAGNIAVYPNPASAEIKVIGNQCSVNGIEIYNSLGEKVYQFVNSHSSLGILPTTNAPMTNAPITINIADFPNGVYLVKLITANGAEVRKFVKE